MKTVKWYKEVKNGASPYNCIMENIKSFLETWFQIKKNLKLKIKKYLIIRIPTL